MGGFAALRSPICGPPHGLLARPSLPTARTGGGGEALLAVWRSPGNLKVAISSLMPLFPGFPIRELGNRKIKAVLGSGLVPRPWRSRPRAKPPFPARCAGKGGLAPLLAYS